MKKFITLLIFTSVVFQNIQAQAVEKSLSAGFITSADLVKPYGDDKWLIAGRGQTEPGGYFEDTLFVAVLGHEGQIYWRKNLNLPLSEIHYWHDVLVLPDGGVLASFESTLCDVGADIISIQRLDSVGNLVWEKTGGLIFGMIRPPENWFLAPDGNLLGAANDQIWKINTSTGDLIWSATLQGGSSSLIGQYDFESIAGTEDFFALGNPDFQRWKQVGNPAAPNYVLQDSLSLPGFRRNLTPGLNGSFYSWQIFPQNQIERIDLNFQVEILPIQLESYGDKSMAVGNNGLYLAETSSDTHRFRKFDFQGENPIDLHSSAYWLSPMAVAAHNNWVAVAGQDGSGVPYWSSYNLTCSGAWLRSFPEGNPFPVNMTPNAAVTEIDQQDLIDTISIPVFPSGYLYNLSGGYFQVKITNQGNQTIEKVCVNVTFEFNQFYDICPNKPSQQKQFNHLDLLPGASTWVNFGSIEAIGQANVPAEICFWTSSPNDQPDAVHEDDRACHPASYTVGLKNLEQAQINLSPNPADQFVAMNFPAEMDGKIWQIFDATGRLAASGTSSNGSKLRLETDLLPNGFYLVKVKNLAGKFIVQH